MVTKMRNSGVVLFVCSGLLLTGGAILGGSAGWQVLRMSYYFWTAELGAELGAGIQLVAGAMLCLPACWLASLVPYHPRSFSLLTTMMFMSTASLIVLCIGLSSMGDLSRVLRDPQAINASMHRAISRESLQPSVRTAFASMQIELRCCGVEGPSDWLKYRRNLPPSCCNRWTQPGKDIGAFSKRDACEMALHTGGCLTPALLELRYYVNSQTVLAATMIFVLAVTLFATAYTLVVGMVERGDLHAGKPAGATAPMPPMRVACLRAPAHFSLLTDSAPATNAPAARGNQYHPAETISPQPPGIIAYTRQVP